MEFLEMKGTLKETMCRTQVTFYHLKEQKFSVSDFSFKIVGEVLFDGKTLILESQSWYWNPNLIYSL